MVNVAEIYLQLLYKEGGQVCVEVTLPPSFITQRQPLHVLQLPEHFWLVLPVDEYMVPA